MKIYIVEWFFPAYGIVATSRHSLYFKSKDLAEAAKIEIDAAAEKLSIDTFYAKIREVDAIG